MCVHEHVCARTQGVCTGDALVAFLTEWANRYSPLPLWLTEFSCYNANATENLRFMREVEQQLVVERRVPALERYAWYATRTFDASGAYEGTNLNTGGDGGLNSLGAAYAGMSTGGVLANSSASPSAISSPQPVQSPSPPPPSPVVPPPSSSLSSPPPSPPPLPSTIKVEFTASGDVSDYTTTVKDEIAASTAARLGVAASDVTVTVLSASVIIHIEIATTSAASTTLMSTLQTSYSSVSGAQSLLSGVTSLSITVEQAPTMTRTSNAPSNYSSSESNTAVVAAAAGGGAAAVVLLIVLIVYMRKRTITTQAGTSISRRAQEAYGIESGPSRA
jgi:hypothetical protein